MKLHIGHLAWTLALGGLLIATPLQAGLTVVSTYPTDGAVSVNTVLTVEFVFNQPIDTTVQYEITDNFYLGVLLYPDSLIGDPDSITISPDLKTIKVHNLRLVPDTRYVFGIIGARSISGEHLEKPVIITFTTGSSLPTGRIEGQVSVPTGTPAGTLIAVFTKLFSDELPVALGVADGTGHYAIPYVPPGTYWIVGIQDVNHTGNLDAEEEIDPVGLYDANGDGFADQLLLAEGQTKTHVDLSLALIQPMTARTRFSQIQSIASNWTSDAVLVMVAGTDNISLQGKSPFWVYLFYSQTLSAYFGMMASTAFIIPFTDWEQTPTYTTAIPENWIDSDAVIDSAEAHGGQVFRALHPNAEIQAFLMPSIMEQLGLASGKSLRPKNHFQKRSFFLSEKIPHFPTLISQGNPVWHVMYTDEETSDMLIVLLDPTTAQFILSWPPPPTSARTNLEMANTRATLWAQDARLVCVLGNQVMVPEGLNTFWSYIYRSSTQDSYWIIVAGGGSQGHVSYEGPFVLPLPCVDPLPSQWVDSPEVIALCEAHGGSAYRSANPNAQVEAYLGYGLYSENPQIPVWWVQYMALSEEGPPTPPPLEFFIHAETGQLITHVENPKSSEKFPETYVLGQNYPNPFNPKTTILYTLQESGHVEMTVHDLQGRLVETLVDAFQTPGEYQVKVDGSLWPSGVYFYRIRINGFEKVRKMLLMR